MADTIFKKTQWVVGTLLPVDDAGNAASYEAGSVAAVSSDPSIFIVEPFGDDELNRKVSGVSPGTGIISFSLRNLAGEVLSGTAEVEVTDTLAVSVTMQFGQPQN